MPDGRDYAWAKVYCDLPRDTKLTVRCPLDRWLYTVLILLARENREEPGVVPAEQSRPRWLAAYTGHTIKGVTVALCYFEDKQMIVTTPDGGLRLLNFEKRQAVAPSDTRAAWRERKSRSRAHVTRDIAVTSPVTSPGQSRKSHGKSHAEDRGQRTEDRDLLPSQPNAVDLPEQGSKERERAARATAAPAAFPLSASHLEFAVSVGFVGDLDQETEKFLDRNRARGERYTDWQAAWKNWIRRAVEYGPARPRVAGRPSRNEPDYSGIEEFGRYLEAQGVQ